MDEPAYPRSTGSPRGQARRAELLAAVTADLAEHGLVEFSLRRAARAAGTTHKVLLYHFGSGDALLAAAVRELRARRVSRGVAAARGASLAQRALALWPVLTSEEGWVLDQAIGLMLYDPQRYGELGRGASGSYLEPLADLCPPQWPEERRAEVTNLILATLRGLLITRRTSDDPHAVERGLAALARVLEREEAAGD